MTAGEDYARISRRQFVSLGSGLAVWPAMGSAVRTDSNLTPIAEPHFPNRHVHECPRGEEWIADILAHVLQQVPNLGGFFTITMSENLTNCFSDGVDWGRDAPNAGDCPRCAARKSLDVIGELIRGPSAMGFDVSETCYNHFQSVANQVEFYILREKLTGTADKKSLLARMRALAEDEIDLARRQFKVARHQSVIAYEASNHYYYTPLDLAEKILNCRHLIEQKDSFL